jgi:SPP1 gp7 family putative phage head morphogenesis protein
MANWLSKPTPHAEAAKQIRGLAPVDRATFDRLPDEFKASAFLITGIAAHDVLQDVRDMIAVIPEGEDFMQTQLRVAARLLPHFGGREKSAMARARILTRATAFRAYNAGIHQSLENSMEAFPYRKRLAVMDERTRDSHRAMNGITLPADSPFWRSHTPPDAHNCRCYVIGVSRAAAERMKREDAAAIKAGRLLPERARVLEGLALQQLESGILNRGLSEQWNLNQEPGKVQWDPSTLMMPMDAVRQRYDAQTWSDFEKWAKGHDIAGLSLWDWLAGQRPGGTTPPPPVKPPVTPPVTPPPAPVAPSKTPVTPTPAPAPTGRTADQITTALQPIVQRLREARTRKMEPEELADINAEALIAIMLPAAERGSWKIAAGRTAGGKRRAKKAMEDRMRLATSILAKVLHPSLFAPNTTIAETKELRASCSQKFGWDPVKRQSILVGAEIHAHESRPIRTLIHEACHAVESMSDVYETMVAFRDKRTVGESLQKLSVLYPMMGYAPGEVTYEDKWVVRGGSHYDGKKYPDAWRATEVFTKGMERLIFETAEFAADDPEYFEVILKAAQKLK